MCRICPAARAGACGATGIRHGSFRRPPGSDSALRWVIFVGVGHRFVEIYVGDHRGGAAAGLALARRCLRRNAGSALGDALRDLVREIEEDAQTLDAIATRLAVRPAPVKQLLGRAAELVGRAKLNGRLTGYSPLSRLLELEALIAGIEAKRQLWLSLEASQARSMLAEFNLGGLTKRAVDQQNRLRPHHQAAAAEALS